MTVAATLPKHLFNPKRHNFFLQVLQCVGVCCSYPKALKRSGVIRVLVDGKVWHLDDGSSPLGAVGGSKGWAVRILIRLFVSSGRSFTRPFLLALAVGSGWELSTAQDKKSDLSLTNVKISVASRDDEKINVRVDLPGKETQKAFDDALTSLARDAPPVPGFRRSKGGKSSNIPNSILLQMLGKSRVTKFVLQEILSITIGDFVRKENLKVNPEIKTTQSEEELESAFTPGSAFGFNVILQLEKSDSDEVSDGSS